MGKKQGNKRPSEDDKRQSAANNGIALESGLEICTINPREVEENIMGVAFAMFEKGKKDSNLGDDNVKDNSEAYSKMVAGWAKSVGMKIPYGDIPAFTCLPIKSTTNMIDLLRKGQESANKIWGGEGSESGPMPMEERLKIANRCNLTDAQACNLYLDKEGLVYDETGAKRVVSCIVAMRAAEFPRLAAGAVKSGLNAGSESARANCNHVCYPFLVSLIIKKFDMKTIRKASMYITGKSNAVTGRLLAANVEEKYDAAYEAIRKKFNVMTMNPMDPRLIPNYCMTRTKIDIAIRMAHATKETVKICNVDELGYTKSPVIAAETLWGIYTRKQWDAFDTFSLSSIAKRLINGLDIIPVLCVTGGLKTKVSKVGDVAGWYLQEDGTCLVKLNDAKYSWGAREERLIDDWNTKKPEFRSRASSEVKDSPRKDISPVLPDLGSRLSRPDNRTPANSRDASKSTEREKKALLDEAMRSGKSPTVPSPKKGK